MKLFADTASVEEIDYCFSRGANDGITTNPMIMKQSGDLSKGFDEACRIILERYPAVPVSLETDLAGIPVIELETRMGEVESVLLRQAYQLSSLGKNVVVKIPICSGGLEATKRLSEDGIKTNVTACMTAYQALEAAKAGATYVSLFANRMLDCNIMHLSKKGIEAIAFDGLWKKNVSENKEKYTEQAWQHVLGEISYVASELDRQFPHSELIIGSIRSPADLNLIKKAQPDIITVPTGIVRNTQNMLELKAYRQRESFSRLEFPDDLAHPMTLYTVQEFENAAASYRK